MKSSVTVAVPTIHGKIKNTVRRSQVSQLRHQGLSTGSSRLVTVGRFPTAQKKDNRMESFDIIYWSVYDLVRKIPDEREP